MEYYTDNSNDRPYDKNLGKCIFKIEKIKTSHDYEYWIKKN